MSIAYCLVSIAPGKEHDVDSELAKVRGIIEIYPLWAKYDMLLKIEAADFHEIGELVGERVKKTQNVIDTKTLLVPENKDAELQVIYQNARREMDEKKA